MLKYINPATEHRKNNMDRLIELAKTYSLPPKWTLYVSAASLRFQNDDLAKIVKIDSCCTMTLDIGRGIKTRSSTFHNPNVVEGWDMVKRTLDAYTRAK